MEASKKMVVIMGMLLLATAMLANVQSLCNMSNDGLKSCLPAVSGENPADPTLACCSAIANADLPCLCHYKSSGLLSFYGVDPDEAMDLPVKCKLMKSFKCN
ncbi:putative lipid-transfer protein DIR1 [Lotus japonicus]|uniref:Bifunctional inhibitor/plant lipid transfer protein/seed storage helical domain-containing protein n=1 Tax=Lotus japonicus TaxID=34305 RepID=I3SKT0_LOTJA|nr:putative lipid-transfer protein DIR1 [Lotus japonicus]AFK40872.1 unknown [Lotus japonicus]